MIEEKKQDSYKGLALTFMVIDLICLPIVCLMALVSPMMSDGGLNFGVYVAIYFFLALPAIIILVIAFSFS